MNVLAIGCHPDDIEINCVGTLLKCAERGDRVTVCHVCNGDMGHEVIMPEKLRVMRIEEAKKAGAMAGFSVVTCDIGDLSVYDGLAEHRDRVMKVIREAQPDFIITHAPNDYMPDHTAVSKLVFDAAFSATCPHYGPEYGAPSRNVPIYYMDNLFGVDFVPTMYVDISDKIDKKLAMLECHESQLKWMRDHDGIDFAECVKVGSRYRGIQSGAQYAEGFRECGAYLKLGTKRLLP